MNADHANKSWLTRLSHLLARPKNQRELLEVLSTAAEQQLLDPAALRMIEGVLTVYQKQVRDIMTPASQMVVIDADASLEEILPILISTAHSRFPVIRETKDEVVGILLAKDLLRFTFNKDEKFNLLTLLRTPTFIPESKKLNVLLDEFRLKRNHLAIVVDEYGSVSGMLTIEDVLEEIVGEIEDEYDVDEMQSNISHVKDNIYTVKALTTLEHFNMFFNTDFSDENFDTVAGLVTQHFGYLPVRDESIKINNIEFKVLHADKRKIRLLQVLKP